MQRKASTLHRRPEAETAYTKYHQAVWPEVLQRSTECNIRNYSIFLRDGILFSYFEYDGEDYCLTHSK
jgi:L-rhamnose mutarotase